MDVDGEWELVIPTSISSSSDLKELPSSFLGPSDLFVETDYFKCPQNTTLLITHHHHLQKHEEEEEEEELPVQQVEEEEEEPVVEEEEQEEDTIASPPAPPFNWLEPDPVLFDHSHKEQGMPMPLPMRRNKELVEEDKDCTGFSLWGLGVNGIGAICSFGVATAATLCVFALGTASASTSGRLRPSPNIQFQIYSDDKRIKDVVQRASGLNHAISAAGGITIPRAHISFGGRYEGL